MTQDHLAPKHTLAAVERLDALQESPTDTEQPEQPVSQPATLQ